MSEATTQNIQEYVSGEVDSRLQAAFEAGLQWGRVRRLTHPNMQPFIITAKGDIQVIDLSKTMEALDRALEFLRETARRGGSVLVVGTHPAARGAVTEFAKRLGFPYVVERWLGGTLTNFKTLASRIQYLKDLEKKITSEEFSSYTKKERMKMQKEAEEIRKKFEGLRSMEKLPDALLMIGLRRHDTALREARRMRIPVIALCNTNDDPTQVTYPIPGNDNSAQAIQFVLQEIARAWEEANPQHGSTN